MNYNAFTISQSYQFAPQSLAGSSLLPLTATITGKRPTIFRTIVNDEIWTQDQQLGIVNVNVPIRSTIIKIPGGGLNVINPIQPTPESMTQLNALISSHGPV
ncbi:hypothetical protein TrRE_jg13155, partial [Triparma retinervis]